MAGQRQSTDLLLLKGSKHLTKQEIKERKAKEIKAPDDNVVAPSYLPKKLKNKFDEVAQQLIDIGIMSNLDCEALARYITQEEQYQNITKKLIKLDPTTEEYYKLLITQEKLFKMCRQGAIDLGLTISSRCKLVIPKPEEKPKNKFEKFGAKNG